ncbi:hypothetical protein FJZ31_08735 [Candidatus Poribacteria bacterium]|nr:hypothetical protein [Candidatus Poribacteria bacterium]
MKSWQKCFILFVRRIWGSKDAKQVQLPRIFQYRYKIPLLALKVALLCIVLIKGDVMRPGREFVLSTEILSIGIMCISSLSLGLWVAKFQVQAVEMGIQNQVYWKDTEPNRIARYILFLVGLAMMVIILLIRYLLWSTAANDNLSVVTFLGILLSYHIGKDIFIIRWSLRYYRV